MSDDERIARLTELARRVWPDVEVERGYGDDAWLVSNESGVALSIDHPRALDALEAALLVLVGKDEPLAKEQAKDVWSEGFATAKRMFNKPPAWVEDLCKQWERDADQESTWRSYSLMACASELRERAAKESR